MNGEHRDGMLIYYKSEKVSVNHIERSNNMSSPNIAIDPST